MREIKFRVWDNKKKIMIIQDNTDRIDKCLTYYELNKSVELMQFTGLKDKNGKEIYEGDIVKIPDDYDLYGFNAGEKYQIYFAYGGFRLKPKYDRKNKAKGFYLEDDKILEKIGNIYENPKILESN